MRSTVGFGGKLRADPRSAASQYADLDALRKTGPGSESKRTSLPTLASHPPEVVSHEFDAICILRHIAIEQWPRPPMLRQNEYIVRTKSIRTPIQTYTATY